MRTLRSLRAPSVARPGTSWLAGIGLLAIIFATPPALGAQDSNLGGLRLLIVDDETGEPVQGAFARVKGRKDLTVDPSGRVSIDSLPAGRIWVEVGAIGYVLRRDLLLIQAGPMPQRTVGLSFTGDKLPDVIVEARQEKLYPRYAEFHRRSQQGAGFYVTWREIKEKGYNRLADVLRMVRGVQVRCPTSDCIIQMSRSACLPTVWVDGRMSDYFGANTPVGDIYGIEVYRGASEMPAEFAGNGMCGAIIVWTKNRPYR